MEVIFLSLLSANGILSGLTAHPPIRARLADGDIKLLAAAGPIL